MNETARDAVRDWAAAVSSLSAIWANQDAPRPAYPYVLLNVLSSRRVGQGETAWTRDPTRPAGEQMRPTYTRHGIHTISLAVLSLAEKMSSSGEETLDALIGSLQRESVLVDLQAANVAFVQELSARNQTEQVRGRWLSRWGADLEFSTVYECTPTDQDIGFVEKVVISSTLTGQDTSADLDKEVMGNVT